MAKATSVLDDVIGVIAARTPRVQAWYHRVPPEHAGALAEILDAWKSGRLGSQKITAARAIAKILSARGISDVGPQGVLKWLEKAQ
jgi:hypothetical protein